jgi:hypothetical protein
MFAPSRSFEGRFAIVRNVLRDAMDEGGIIRRMMRPSDDEGVWS